MKRQPWVHSLGLKEAFWNSDFNTTLQDFLSGYIEWLAELADNDRSFAPYNLGVSGRRLYDIVNGKEASKGGIGWDRTPRGIDLMDARLNRECGKPAKSAPKEQRFMELFFIVTQHLVKKKYQE